MTRISSITTSLAATLAFAITTAAQTVVITHDATNDVMVAFSPVDGSLVSSNVFAMPNNAQVGSILVGNEIWVSDQNDDIVTRFDVCGNVLGTMGPTLAGGGMDNIRGLTLIGGIVYVTNDGTGNGATADSLVTFDTAGNYLGTLPLSSSGSPFAVIPFQGDLLVVSSSGGATNDEIHRYTTAGVSVGQFYGGTTFGHQIQLASDGNVWLTTFTGNTILKLDATNGNNVLQTVAVTQPRGVYELLNGNLLYTNSTGTHVYDMMTSTSTQVYAGGNYHLNLVNLDFACHKTIGAGCHDYNGDRSNLFQLFADVPSAKAALDGNAVQYTLTPTGYVSSWVPGGAGALFVPPSVGATVIANVSTGQQTFTPSAPILVPGGVTADWTLSSEGILTAGATGNQGTDTTPTLAETATQGGLAFYTWCTQNPTESGSGKFKWEEVGGVLYVTADGVEFSGGTPTAAQSTYQWQINMATGDVTMLWTSFSSSNSTSDVLVGCTLAATGLVPVSKSLATLTVLDVDNGPLAPLTLSASPAPLINPSTLVSYTASNLPEFVPGSGIYIGTMFLSVNPLPGGFDLTGILSTVPGCSAYIATLDLDLGGMASLSPSMTWSFSFDNVFFAPGNVIAAQAVALFDGSFPLLNGESGGFLLSNGLLSTTFTQ